MDRERIKELAQNPEFIPEIYNYCDRWCERCPFTARCLNFALSEEQFPTPEDNDAYNQVFWHQLSEMFYLTRGMVEDVLKEEGIHLEDLDLEMKKEQEQIQDKTAEQHECAQAAKAYGDIVDHWFDVCETLIEEKRIDLQSEVELDLSLSRVIDKATGFEDILEIVRWYQHQIYVKVLRALSGQRTDRQNEVDEQSKDSDGSAKVALIGIDRSIIAWIRLREYIPEQKDDIIDLLVHLDRQRKNIEQHFPNARAFVRPGFDEVSQ